MFWNNAQRRRYTIYTAIGFMWLTAYCVDLDGGVVVWQVLYKHRQWAGIAIILDRYLFIVHHSIYKQREPKCIDGTMGGLTAKRSLEYKFATNSSVLSLTWSETVNVFSTKYWTLTQYQEFIIVLSEVNLGKYNSHIRVQYFLRTRVKLVANCWK